MVALSRRFNLCHGVADWLTPVDRAIVARSGWGYLIIKQTLIVDNYPIRRTGKRLSKLTPRSLQKFLRTSFESRLVFV
jgi:hypothetical protein